MKNKLTVTLLFAITTQSTFANVSETTIHSAKRQPQTSWISKADHYLEDLENLKPIGNYTDKEENDDLVLDKITSLENINQKIIPEWESFDKIKEFFIKARDERFIEWEINNTPFLRRSSWLYPDDGCFARAGLVIQNAEKWNSGPSAKIFVFGDLEVKTPNSPEGTVNWWYHVAPIVKSNENLYVLDPALNAGAPLLIKDWLSLMSKNPNELKMAICNSYSYTPGSPCVSAKDTEDNEAINDQKYYLKAEWGRLEKLGRNPTDELGDAPPWKEKTAQKNHEQSSNEK